jgi:hypothetical protein
MSFRVTAGVWLGTVCGLSLTNKFLVSKECEAETGQAVKGLFPGAAGLEVESHSHIFLGSELASSQNVPPKHLPIRMFLQTLIFLPLLSLSDFFMPLSIFIPLLIKEFLTYSYLQDIVEIHLLVKRELRVGTV